jgi:hypothetical protein
MHGRADLKKARVITQPGEGAHISNRELGGGGQKPRKRITQRHHGIASANRSSFSEHGNGGCREAAANDGQVVFVIACD